MGRQRRYRIDQLILSYSCAGGKGGKGRVEERPAASWCTTVDAAHIIRQSLNIGIGRETAAGPARIISRTITQWFFLAHRPDFRTRSYLFLPLFSTYTRSGPLQIFYFVFISKFLKLFSFL